MRILVVSQFFPPDVTAAAFRIGDAASYLAARGHEVRVITAEPHKGTVGDAGAVTGIHEDVSVVRCPIKEVEGRGTKAYLAHYMSFVKGSTGRGVRMWREGWKPDVIYVSSPPLFVGVTGRTLSALFRRPVVFEVRDIWPDSAVAAGQLSEGGRAYKIGRKLEKYCYRKAAQIICVAEPMKRYIETQCKNKTVTVLYNGVRETDIPTDDVAPKSESSGGPRTLLYAGNFGHVQDMELLAQGFIEANRAGTIDGWKLRLIGGGVRLDALNQIIADNDAGDIVQIDPPMTREDVFQEMRGADALYLSLQHSPVLEHTIPSKVFDYMMAARPVVAGLAGEGREILQSTGANLCFEPSNLEQFKGCLATLNNDIDALAAHANKNRELVRERFTRERAVDQLEKIFEEVVG